MIQTGMSQKPVEEQSWLVQELERASLGDKRLVYRLLHTGQKLAAQPSASIPQACDDWADTKAAYRLFDNEKVTQAAILEAHQARTVARSQGQKRVLAIQDTSFLNYSHHPQKEGLGPIGSSDNLQGMILHSSLICTETGLPLGIAHQKLWTRDEQAKQRSSEQRRKVPIEEKESYKWLETMESVEDLMPDELDVVHIGDREADIFELFAQAKHLDTHLLVRATQDRRLAPPEVDKLWATVKRQAVVGGLIVDIPASKERPARKAKVTVRICSVKITPPTHLQKQYEPVPLYVIYLQEDHPPQGADPITWLLLTTLPVHNFEQALACIRYYTLRWHIEIFHRILKSGCQVEKRQLATTERLKPLIALLCVIAWRIFWLTHLGRHHPQAPCTHILAEHEWKALYAHHHRSPHLPKKPPSISQAIGWIAQLGGYLGRKNDGPPGVTVIWRGWQRLADISDAYLIFNPSTCG